MDLSVVIVSYNVRAFLEQCLVSVERASSGLDLEVWVVDNNSVDGSVEMVRSRFPEVHLVANRDNVGFSVANNQAIRQSKGEHVLLLNPDTVVREDTFVKGLAHMKAHPEVGGMGVPMYDGTGQFLPESKRGVPTPWAAFCRMAGLHHLAPRSPKWNAYYAGHVAEDETAEIDILSGAFMWMRKKALDDVGLLDEQFFMYGEDIDLSWRLVQGGWRNHYLASTSIIHYKGESTKKGSLNYVLVFYRAMLLFAAKHFEGRQAKLFSWMIRLAIYGRAGLAIVRRLFSRWGELIQVAALSTVLLVGWLVLLDTDGSRQLTWQDVGWQAPVLLGIQWLGMWALGGYRETRNKRSLSGQLVSWMGASLLTWVVYGMWPEGWRFSRAGVLGLVAGHGLAHGFTMYRSWKRGGNPFHVRRVLVAAEDLEKMVDLLRRNEGERTRHHSVALWSQGPRPSDAPVLPFVPWVGGVDDLEEALQIHDADEVVFSGRDVSTDLMVQSLEMLGKRHIHCRIAWTDAGDVMSSGGASRPAFDSFSQGLHVPEVARTKRMFDVLASLAVLLAVPVLWASGRARWGTAARKVLVGRWTWVRPGSLTSDRPWVLDLANDPEERSAQRKAFTHGRDYHWKKDLSVVVDALISHRAIISHGHH